MRGTLGNLNLQPPEPLETNIQRLDVTNDVRAALESRGISQRPLTEGYKGEMPPDITALDNDELNDLLKMLSEWTGYLEEQLALAEMEFNTAKAQMDVTEASLRLAVKASAEVIGRINEADRKAYVVTEPRYQKAKHRLLYTEAIYEFTRRHINAGQRNWETVSRRISVRIAESDRQIRNNNVENVPIAARTFRRPGQPPA
jgi:hypothetical protein